jgi:hypothetical protein
MSETKLQHGENGGKTRTESEQVEKKENIRHVSYNLTESEIFLQEKAPSTAIAT